MLEAIYNPNLNITRYSNYTFTSLCSRPSDCYYIFFIVFCPVCFPFILVYLVKLSIKFKKSKRKNRVYNLNLLFKEKPEKDTTIKTCVICYDDIEYKDLVVLKCDHNYHEFCIKKWLDINLVCPICKKRYEINN
jgi:hypothetical protein